MTPEPDADIRAWLDSHVNLETGVGAPASGRRVDAPTLARIQSLLRVLGNPELDLRVIHVTGTNGKTSTTRICVSLLRALGLRVGSYTSPHLAEVNERICLDGTPVPDDVLDELLAAVRAAEPSVSEPLSFFEILTASALRCFADSAVDVAVVEVGMGGTWDATNVVDAEVAVVTNVSIDHVEYLGPTRADIASEKAGIVGPNATLVLGEADPELRSIFTARNPARLLLRGADFGVSANRLAVGGRSIDLFTPAGGRSELFLALHGAHQADNAVAALTAAETLAGVRLHDEVVAAGLSEVTTPGRMEVVGRSPLVILDGAHNVEGASVLVRCLSEEFGAAPRTLVVGLLEQKDPHEMLSALHLSGADRLIACRPPSPRGRDPRDLAEAAVDLGFDEDRIEMCETAKQAVGAAMLVTPAEGQIVVTGTLYLVGAIRSIMVDE